MPPGDIAGHLDDLVGALRRLPVDRLVDWGQRLHAALAAGGRLLVAGNGGSAAEAQHLSAELVGRFSQDRRPFSAIALHAESSSVTAIGNDYGFDEIFARQVQAHGRPGDILILLSTSGASSNVLRAAAAASGSGLRTWALTGPAPNELSACCDEAVTIDGNVPVVQECHLTAVHLICMGFERARRAADQSDQQQDATPDADPAEPWAVDTRAPASAGPGTTGSCIAAPGPAGPSTAAPAGRPGPGGRDGRGQRLERLLVIGDSLLDRDQSGQVERLSPEAPVPVVGSLVTSVRPGGAGLAAVLARRGGRPVTLITALSADEDGALLRELLTAADVEVVDLGLAGPTPVKTRIRAAGRSLLMLDGAPPTPGRIAPRDWEPAERAIRQAAAVVVADYGRGVTALSPLRRLIAQLAGRLPVVWDPHPRGSEPPPGVRLVTPNAREAGWFSPEVAGTGLNADVERARDLLRRWSAAVAVTLGERGAVLVSDGEFPPLVVPVPLHPHPAVGAAVAMDACGAGDLFSSRAAELLAGGALLSEAVTEAVAAASAYVANGGPRSLTPLSQALAPADGSDPDGLALAGRVRAAGGRVVATGGCFDLLHPGHVSLLQQARALGDCLIVCLNSDRSIARIKGPGRPVVGQPDRALVLEALECVDAVVAFDEDTPERLLDRLRPDIFVKGGDYANADIPEAALVRRWGGQVVTVPYLDGRSTTSLIRRAAGRAAVSRAHPAGDSSPASSR